MPRSDLCPTLPSEPHPFDTIERERLPELRATLLTGRRGADVRAVVVPDHEWFMQAHAHLEHVHLAGGDEPSHELGEHCFDRAAVAFLMD